MQNKNLDGSAGRQNNTPVKRGRLTANCGKDAMANVRALRPEVNILIPYYFEKGQFVSPEYETKEFREELKSWFAPLGLQYVWRPVTPPAIRQVVSDLVNRNADVPIVVLNLCDGIDQVGTPGVSVVEALTAAGLPFSGADAAFYSTSTSKLSTKKLLRSAGVFVGPSVVIEDLERDTHRAIDEIGFPLFIKPDISSGSFGVGVDSVCYDVASMQRKVQLLRKEAYFDGNAIFAEPFIVGREFTVLVVEDGSQPSGLYVLPPGERVFDQRVPLNEQFLAYERYWNLPEDNRPIPEGDPYYWYAAVPSELGEEIADLVRTVFRAVEGTGYARIDLRQCAATGQLHVLEVNAQCGLSQDQSSTCGSLLGLSGKNMAEIIELILNHALTRTSTGSAQPNSCRTPAMAKRRVGSPPQREKSGRPQDRT